MSPSKTQKSCNCAGGGGDSSRRSFCKSALGLGMGAAALSLPVYSGARMALYPLEQEGLAGKEYQLTTLEALDETPRQFVVRDNVTDGWTTSPNQTIGVIYLSKRVLEDGTSEVLAFQSVCPHAGCRVKVGVAQNPTSGEEETLFTCPCHGDMFYLTGERVVPDNSKSARDLDSLETRVDEEGRVFVQYQNFQLGVAEKKSV